MCESLLRMCATIAAILLSLIILTFLARSLTFLYQYSAKFIKKSWEEKKLCHKSKSNIKLYQLQIRNSIFKVHKPLVGVVLCVRVLSLIFWCDFNFVNRKKKEEQPEKLRLNQHNTRNNFLTTGISKTLRWVGISRETLFFIRSFVDGRKSEKIINSMKSFFGQ